VTKDGYDPSRALRWSDLEAQPFLTATDPAMQGDAYRMKGTLPKKSGRQIIYTIWRNSSTADTYYSCADVVFSAAKAPSSKKPASSAPSAAAPVTTAPAAAPPAQAALNQAEPTPSLVPKAATSTDDVPNTGFVIAALGVVVALAVAGTTVAVRRRRR
jgi:predicted carbohydrate-binding protein with CBM5 and CBM33 domain